MISDKDFCVKMWCLISQPNAVILEVEVDPKAKGQECLEKVCRFLGIGKEEDYFGLKYHSPKGEELWLNLRNQIDRQVAGLPPYRFALRVKFWVPPHLILQDATRHQFFLHARLELLEGRLRAPDWDTCARLLAFLAQAEQADDDLPSSLVPLCAGAPSDLMHRVASERLHIRAMKPSTAEYWLLKEVSNLDTFGHEQFNTKFPDGTAVVVGVGPHGVSLYDADASLRQSIPYSAIQRASSQRRSMHLLHLEGAGATEARLELKLDSSHAAASLYRCITEKHAFYSCETVRSAVTAQFIRDLKGTIVSIFNEDTTLGKKYVFDIRRTCREVYDNARRALYQSGESQQQRPMETEEQSSCQLAGPMSSCSSPGHCHSGITCPTDKCKESREQLAGLLDAMSCCICMDNDIDTAFFPCGHVISCHRCAARCERCPLCRADIAQAKTVFLPMQLRVRSQC